MKPELVERRDRAAQRHNAAEDAHPSRDGDVFRSELEAVIRELGAVARVADDSSSEPIELARTYRYLGDAYFDLGRGVERAALELGVNAYKRADELLTAAEEPLERAKLDFNYGNTLRGLSGGTDVELLEAARFRYKRAADSFRAQQRPGLARIVVDQLRTIETQLLLASKLAFSPTAGEIPEALHSAVDLMSSEFKKRAASVGSARDVEMARVLGVLQNALAKRDAESIATIAHALERLAKPSASDPEVRAIEARIEMLEATVKLIVIAAESPDTNPADAKELRTLKSEVESVIAKAKKDPQSLSSSLDIALVVGHSPMKPGAFGQLNGRKYSEFAYNAELAPLLVRNLSARGLKTEMFLRDSSGGILSGISAAAARTPALIVELHANAFNGKVRGCSAMIRPNDKGAEVLAENILTAIHESTGIPVRKVMKVGRGERGALALYATTKKAILLHPFFLDNQEDLTVATEHMDRLADAIAAAIAKSFNA